jgi:hypothetical protein
MRSNEALHMHQLAHEATKLNKDVAHAWLAVCMSTGQYWPSKLTQQTEIYFST